MTAVFINGLLLGLIVAISIGPAFFALIQTGINHGFKYGVFMAIGIVVSDAMLVTISYLLGASLFDDPKNKVFIGLIGGIVLIIFGSVAWAKKPDILKQRNLSYDTPIKSPSLWLYPFRGFFLNIVNPFLFFFWFGSLSIVGKMAPPNELMKYTLIFFSGTFITIFLTDCLKSYVGKKIKNILTPKKEILINKLVGIALVIFGIVLIFRTLDEYHFFELIISKIK